MIVIVWRRGLYNPRDSHPTAWHRIEDAHLRWGRAVCGARAPRGPVEYHRSDNIQPRGLVCERCDE